MTTRLRITRVKVDTSAKYPDESHIVEYETNWSTKYVKAVAVALALGKTYQFYTDEDSRQADANVVRPTNAFADPFLRTVPDAFLANNLMSLPRYT